MWELRRPCRRASTTSSCSHGKWIQAAKTTKIQQMCELARKNGSEGPQRGRVFRVGAPGQLHNHAPCGSLAGGNRLRARCCLAGSVCPPQRLPWGGRWLLLLSRPVWPCWSGLRWAVRQRRCRARKLPAYASASAFATRVSRPAETRVQCTSAHKRCCRAIDLTPRQRSRRCLRSVQSSTGEQNCAIAHLERENEAAMNARETNCQGSILSMAAALKSPRRRASLQ